jgi:acetyl esterase/lipase
VFYGEDELLASEASDFALRAQAAGNDLIVRPVEAGQHSFIIGAGRVSSARHAEPLCVLHPLTGAIALTGIPTSLDRQRVTSV